MFALFDYFPQPLRPVLYRLPETSRNELEEIRLRCQCGLQLKLRSGFFYADKQGRLLRSESGSFTVTRSLLSACLEQFTASSLYSKEQELSNGFLTLEGGHRVGFCGTCTVKEGKITAIRDISSVNVRVSHQMIGVSDSLMPYLIRQGRVKNTLIISPPGCGKTTLLRDIARNLSDGFDSYPGTDVAIADERGELGAVHGGIPGNDLGRRTDILHCAPKAEGMITLLRSMSPNVLITDEIGSRQDETAVKQATLSGVSVICSAHGYSRRDIAARLPELEALFELFITLECTDGVHQIKSVEEDV